MKDKNMKATVKGTSSRYRWVDNSKLAQPLKRLKKIIIENKKDKPNA